MSHSSAPLQVKQQQRKGGNIYKYYLSLSRRLLRFGSFNSVSVCVCVAAEVRNNLSLFPCPNKTGKFVLGYKDYCIDSMIFDLDCNKNPLNFNQPSQLTKLHLHACKQFLEERPSFVSITKLYHGWKGPIIIIEFKEFCFL